MYVFLGKVTFMFNAVISQTSFKEHVDPSDFGFLISLSASFLTYLFVTVVL